MRGGYVTFIVLLLIAPVLPGVDASGAAVRYVTGTGGPPGILEGGLVCTPGEFGVGGACRIEAWDGMLVSVTDDLHGPWGFTWVGLTWSGNPCGVSGHAGGRATIHVPERCDVVNIWPAHGATTGFIVVE